MKIYNKSNDSFNSNSKTSENLVPRNSVESLNKSIKSVSKSLKSLEKINKQSQTDSLIMQEYKNKMENVKTNENFCEVYPSILKKKKKHERRDTLNLMDGLSLLSKPLQEEDYTSIKYSEHKYVNDDGSNSNKENC